MRRAEQDGPLISWWQLPVGRVSPGPSKAEGAHSRYYFVMPVRGPRCELGFTGSYRMVHPTRVQAVSRCYALVVAVQAPSTLIGDLTSLR